jgi:hypothetical protein
MGMSEPTSRDRTWLAVIDALRKGEQVRIVDVAYEAEDHMNSAQAVLHVAEEAGLFERDSPQAEWFTPSVGALAEVDD